jgi:hypothetical protein
MDDAFFAATKSNSFWICHRELGSANAPSRLSEFSARSYSCQWSATVLRLLFPQRFYRVETRRRMIWTFKFELQIAAVSSAAK